ncbi:uncharacterized protein LOC144152269 isoform X3 [Haemaphysalis longicornis]
MFVLRLVTLDHYMVAPSAPLDPLVSKLGGWEVWQVPVIRIFGITPAGQKACLHVHGAMPYLTVPCTEPRPERFAVVLASEIDLLLNTAAGRATSMHRHVHHVSVIRATPLYGFHDREQTFLRIFLYNPLHVAKVSELLLSGLVLKRVMQPHEAHVPFTLQFMVDHNLHGMGLVRVDPFKFRRPTCWKPSGGGEGGGARHSGTAGRLWDLHSLPPELFGDLEKQAVCELELDCCARDILNAQETEAALNPGLAALWQEEEERRQEPLMWTPLSVEDEDFPSSESEQFYLARLDKLLAKPDRSEQTGAKPKKSHHHNILDTSHSSLDSQDEALAEALAQAASSWRQEGEEDSILGSQPPPLEEEEEEEEEDMSQVFQLAGGPEEEGDASSLSDHSDGNEAYDPFQLDGTDDGPPPAAREGCRHQGTQTGVRPPVLVRRLLGRARERRRTRLSLQRPPAQGTSGSTPRSTTDSTPLSSGASTPYGAGSSTSLTPHSVADFASVTTGGYTSLSTGGSTPRSASGSTPCSTSGSTLTAETPSAVHSAGDSTRDASPAPEDWQRWQSHHVASQLRGPPKPPSVSTTEVGDLRLQEGVKLPCWVELVRLSSAEIDRWCRPGRPPQSRRGSQTKEKDRPPRGRRKRGRSTESSAASSPAAHSQASSKQCEDFGLGGQDAVGEDVPVVPADGRASRAQKKPRTLQDAIGGDTKKRKRRAARVELASSPSASADSERSRHSPTPLAASRQGSEEPGGGSNGRPSIICRIRIQGRNRVVVLPPRIRQDGDGAEGFSGQQPGDTDARMVVETSDVPVPTLPGSESSSPGALLSACSDTNASPSAPTTGLAGLSSEAKSGAEASSPAVPAPVPAAKSGAVAKRVSSKKRGPSLGGSPLGGTDTALLVSEFVRLELTDSPTVDSNTDDVNMPSEVVSQMGGPSSGPTSSKGLPADQSSSSTRPATPWGPFAPKTSPQALPSGTDATRETLVPTTSVVSSEGGTEQSGPSPLSSASSSPLVIKRRRRKMTSSKRSLSSSPANVTNFEAAGSAGSPDSRSASKVTTRGRISRGSAPGSSTKQNLSEESCPSASPGLATCPAGADGRASSPSPLQGSSSSISAALVEPSTAPVVPGASDPAQPSEERSMRLRRRREPPKQSSSPKVPARRSKRRSTFSGTPLSGNLEAPDIEDLLSSPCMSRGFEVNSPPSQGLVMDTSKPETGLDASDGSVGKLATRGSVKKKDKPKSSGEPFKRSKTPRGTRSSSSSPVTKGRLPKKTGSCADGSDVPAVTGSADTPSVASLTDSLKVSKTSLSGTEKPVSTSESVGDESQEVGDQSVAQKPLKKVRKNQSRVEKSNAVPSASEEEAGDRSSSAANARRLTLRKRPPKASADTSSSQVSTTTRLGKVHNVKAAATSEIKPAESDESDAQHRKPEDAALSSGPLRNSPPGASEEVGPDRLCGPSSPVAVQDSTDFDELAAAIAGLNADFQPKNADDSVPTPIVPDVVDGGSLLNSTPNVEAASAPSFGASLSSISVDTGRSQLDSGHSQSEARDSSSPVGVVSEAGEAGCVAQPAAFEVRSDSGQVALSDLVEDDKPKSVSSRGSPILENGPSIGVEGKARSPESVAQSAHVKTTAAVAATTPSDNADAVQKAPVELAGTPNHGEPVSRSPRAGVVSHDMSLSDSLACLLDSSAADMFFLPSQPDETGLDRCSTDDEGDNVSKSTSKPEGQGASEEPVNAEGRGDATGSAVGSDKVVQGSSGGEASGGGGAVLEKKDSWDSWPDNSSGLLSSGDLEVLEAVEAEELEDGAAGGSPKGSGSVRTADEVSDDCLPLGSDDDGWVLLDEAEDESVELFASSEEAVGNSPVGSPERGSESGGEDVGPGDEAGEVEAAIEDAGSADDVADVGGVSPAHDVDSEDAGKDSKESSGEDIGRKGHREAAIDEEFVDNTSSEHFGKDSKESSGKDGIKDHGEAASDEDFADHTCPAENTELDREPSPGAENAKLVETVVAMSTKVPQVEVTRLDDVEAESELGLLFAKAKQALMHRKRPPQEALGQQGCYRLLKEAEGFIKDIDSASAERVQKCQKKPRKDLSLSSRQKTSGKAKQTDQARGDAKSVSRHRREPGQQGIQDNPKETASVVEGGESALVVTVVECPKASPITSPASGQQATCDMIEAAAVIVGDGQCASMEGAVKCKEEPPTRVSSERSTCDNAEEAASVEHVSVKETREHQNEPHGDPLETSLQESSSRVDDASWVSSGEGSALGDVAFDCQGVPQRDATETPCHPSGPCAQAEEATWVGGDADCTSAEMAYPPDEPAAETAKVPGLFEQSLDLSELPDALERLLGTVPLPELDADCFSLGAEPVNWLAAERSKPSVEAKEELLEEDSVLQDLAQGCSLTNEGLVALVPAQPPPPRCGLLPRDSAAARKRGLRKGFAFWQKAKLQAFASASCFEVDFEHNPELRIAFCRERTVVLTPARCPPSGPWLARRPRPEENGGSPGKLAAGEAGLLDPSTPPATPPTGLPVTPPADARDVSVDTSRDTPSKHEEERGRTLTLLSVEVHVRTRGELQPDPAQDPVQCVLWYARGGPRGGAPQAGALYWLHSGSDPRLAEGSLLLPRTGVTSLQGEALHSERDLLAALVELVARWDPDVLLGYDVERGSWGYLCERAQHLDVDLRTQLSRAPPRRGSSEDIVGRILLGVWRILRKEIALNVYTFENTYYHVMHHRVPLYSFRTLTDWFAQDLVRWRTVEHFAVRARGNVELLDELDVLGKTSEMARIYGIQFLEVLSRGSQFRVESMLLRLARARRLVALSPSSAQRARQRAPEFVPLILEPRAQLYTDPVVVLDFQSLYPSVIIAHNYCFSTCLGRVDSLGLGGAFPFGCSTLEVHLPFLKTLQGHITVSPAGVAFVRPSIRRGLLPQMLNEVLGTRLMVKGAMSRCTDKALRRVLEAQQLGLKLLANVTYGYTAAGFSGRMPCVEVADSVVSKGREALERAIRTVESTVPGARVIYGDTDSLFVLLEGRTRQEAFELGQQMADRVTADNPRPMRLRMEKVYQPCVLQTKKRYVGFAYEHPDQQEPKYDAKGIETVRRDTCPAVAKMLEKMLRVLFSSRDVGAVKRFVKLQFSKILAERVSPQDFVFAREFRGLTGYQPGACVPALEIAQRLVRRDPRAEPLVGERVPYLVVYGHPGQRLIELVRQPGELLRQASQWRLNAHYYVQRVIGPALNRVLRLLGADCLHWYEELPRPRFVTPTTHPGRLSSYLVVGQLCLACGGQAEARQLCGSCEADPSYTALVLGSKVQRVQKALLELQSVCRSCMGFQAAQPPPCVSVDCPVLYKLARVTTEAQQAIGWHNSNSVRLHLPLS